jgi:uncharacterized protein
MMVIKSSGGVAFTINRGQVLTVSAPQGEQVADLLAFNAADTREVISSGRTLDYLAKLCPTTGDALYSNRSNEMLRIIEDTVGCHDFLLTPCSADTFRLLYERGSAPSRGCFENLADALLPYGIVPDHIPVAFNIFMNVKVGQDGGLTVAAPLNRAGDRIKLLAVMDLIIGLTACSAPMSNNGSLKPVNYEISDAPRRER